MNHYTTKSRYGVIRTLTEISDNLYIVEGKSEIMRVSNDFIDFEGGPFLMIGENLSMFGLPDKIIKKIENYEGKWRIYV